ncbi:MAG TPA: LamG-like jellyroll fold domain-containing protein [Sumerlaeia bacterium]|nr:LamG-like jellyroll fold domain-containing protein [Sumerlaeia bacterium]
MSEEQRTDMAPSSSQALRGNSLRLCGGLLAVALVSVAWGGEPIHVGSRLEPFVDDCLIDGMSKVQLVLHKPIPRNVAIDCNAPWEGNTSAYFTIFKDGDICRMYYRGNHFDEEAGKPTPEKVCYAESRDGVRFTKPSLGIVEYEGSTDNNIILSQNAHCFAPFKDENPNCAPDARYKALSRAKGGLQAYKSSDGLHWALIQEEPVITEGAFDSQNLAFWDAVRGRYVDFHRDLRQGFRDIKTCTSDDFIHWTKPQWLEYTGAPREHLYTNAITPYYRAPHVFFGFPKRFVPGPNPAKHAYAGVSDGVFMTSRDGKTFKRWGEALVRPGPQIERWVNRNNMTAWGIVETKSDIPGTPNELSIYSSESYYRGPSARLRRYTIRIDGFVSVQASRGGGEFFTRPLAFDPPKTEGQVTTAPGPVSVVSSRVLIGKQSLEFREPASLIIPGTQNLGEQATLAVHVRGVPKGHRRLFSAYNGGETKPKELYFDVGAGNWAIRWAYDGRAVNVASEKVEGWPAKGDPDAVHHLAATWDNGVVTLYFDGKEVAKGGATGRGSLELALGDLRFGEDYPPASMTNEPFLGTADDILAVRRVLSADEIAKMAREGAAAALGEAEKGALYTMEKRDGTILIDELAQDGQQNALMPSSPGVGDLMLFMNCSTSAAGSIRCELQDETGSPIPGYTLDESDEILGDGIRQAMSWQGGSELKQFSGKPIRLRFVMVDADLYSIQFASPGNDE